MEIKEIKALQSKSDKAVVELLRGYLDKAFSEKITFIEICTTIDGKYESISISCGNIK